MDPTALPHGFRETNTGLVVPEALSREREVWAKDEGRLIDRATKLLQSRGLLLKIACGHQRCQGQKAQFIRQPSGDVVLRCEHKDRVFTNAF